MDGESQWLAHLGEDREEFLGWVAFGHRPSHDPELAARYDRCASKLSLREIEECQAFSRANTFDIVYGRERAQNWMANQMSIIARKYQSGGEVEADSPIVVFAGEQS